MNLNHILTNNTFRIKHYAYLTPRPTLLDHYEAVWCLLNFFTDIRARCYCHSLQVVTYGRNQLNVSSTLFLPVTCVSILLGVGEHWIHGIRLEDILFTHELCILCLNLTTKKSGNCENVVILIPIVHLSDNKEEQAGAELCQAHAQVD